MSSVFSFCSVRGELKILLLPRVGLKCYDGMWNPFRKFDLLVIQGKLLFRVTPVCICVFCFFAICLCPFFFIFQLSGLWVIYPWAFFRGPGWPVEGGQCPLVGQWLNRSNFGGMSFGFLEVVYNTACIPERKAGIDQS